MDRKERKLNVHDASDFRRAITVESQWHHIDMKTSPSVVLSSLNFRFTFLVLTIIHLMRAHSNRPTDEMTTSLN
jgi:hypothetical protein